jgi:hypothetical protein
MMLSYGDCLLKLGVTAFIGQPVANELATSLRLEQVEQRA